MKKSIIYFDGVCGLCNGFVDWIIRQDRHKQFLFAPIQGETAQAKLGPLPVNTGEWTIYYQDQDGGEYERSEAVLRILIRLGGFFKIAKFFYIFPLGFRDWCYKHVAKNRYKMFGKKDSCRIPTAEEKNKFLP